MSDTRAQLNTYIDTNITDKTEDLSLTPTDEGNALKRVADYVDSHAAVIVADTQATTTILTASNADFEYSLVIWRTTNTVHINGTIKNATGVDALTARSIATINAAWRTNVDPMRFNCFDAGGVNNMRVNITATQITLAADINDQNVHIVNISYPAIQ